MGRPPKEVDNINQTNNVNTELPRSSVVIAVDEEAEKKDTYSGDCLNCLNHGINTELQRDGTCSSCGFDKTKLYGAF